MNAEKLKDLVKTGLASGLEELLLTTDNTGKYYLFGKYVILNHKNIFKVYCLKTGCKLEFSSLKNATAYCILENAGKYKDARRIEQLDLKLSSINIDIAVHKNIIKRARSNFTSMVSLTKLQQDNYKRKIIITELTCHIDNSKRIQENNFKAKDSKFKYLR